uniref:Uncharacterized protein n=1 Tax=Hyaloperonospora arabidopsidis (strain Emoy2) TaxID=559515 RepID=M4BEM7_HYAAE
MTSATPRDFHSYAFRATDRIIFGLTIESLGGAHSPCNIGEVRHQDMTLSNRGKQKGQHCQARRDSLCT